METEFNNRDESNEIMKALYAQENYRVIDCNPQSSITYVFFSGNGLFYPATIENVERTMIDGDRYEWENIGLCKAVRKAAHKVILIRDVFQSWYVTGINPRYDTIEKTIRLVAILAGNDEIITVGSSAGGYMAIVTAVLLHAKYCFAAGPQIRISLYDDENPLIKKYSTEPDRSKYFDISALVASTDVPIYYYYPCRCLKDIEQYALIEENVNVRLMNLDSENHGTIPLSIQIPGLLTKSTNELDKISKKIGERRLGKVKWLLESEGYVRGGYSSCSMHLIAS